VTTANAGTLRWDWRWLILLLPAAAVVVTMAVLFARGLRELPQVQEWIVAYPGTTPLPEVAPVGIPAWLAWTHFLNAFFIVLIIKSGWAVRTVQRPSAFWTRKVLVRRGTQPKRLSLDLWMHLSVDALWIANGLTYVALLLITGQWMRIVPTSWEFVPNTISAALQYVSMDWPTEDGWVNYNSLQVLAYFVTVFIAAPLAFITGLRMSPIWPQSGRLADRLNRAYPIEWARRVHFPVMLYFVLFLIVHVTLVLATGAVRNLNHMYAARDEISWLGVALFAGSLALMVAAVLASRPVLLRPIAALTGKVSR
jgi:thiosulfate reductase cytochrome b subunit